MQLKPAAVAQLPQRHSPGPKARPALVTFRKEKLVPQSAAVAASAKAYKCTPAAETAKVTTLLPPCFPARQIDADRTSAWQKSTPVALATAQAVGAEVPLPTFVKTCRSSPEARPADSPPVQYCVHSVPCIRFQVLFTLLSKYFSSFAHATCSLSVSQPYLALDEIYHPICPGVPTKTTLKTHNIWFT